MRPAAHPRTWLYVPGHRPERVAKALRAGADAVVVDLEDAVPADAKELARTTALDVLAQRSADDPVQVWVRVNDVLGPWGEQDVDALAGAGADGLRLPRVERPDVVAQVAARVRGPLQLLLETALGLSRAGELAAADPWVRGVGLGEADLAADLRVVGDEGLDWARGAVVVASRAAGLASPVQSVWTDVRDLDGLRTSTVRGRATGFLGRSVVHPAQIPVVHAVLTPSPAELAAAIAVLDGAARAAERGEVAVLDDDGRFIDPAVVARAHVVLDLARPRPLPDTTTPPGDDA